MNNTDVYKRIKFNDADGVHNILNYKNKKQNQNKKDTSDTQSLQFVLCHSFPFRMTIGKSKWKFIFNLIFLPWTVSIVRKRNETPSLYVWYRKEFDFVIKSKSKQPKLGGRSVCRSVSASRRYGNSWDFFLPVVLLHFFLLFLIYFRWSGEQWEIKAKKENTC